MLGLWLGRFEWAGKNANSSVLNFLGHLGVGEVLVDDDAVNELSVFETATSLGDDLDVLEVNILSVEISYCKHCFHSDFSHLILTVANDLGS
jgi:hypothetical protein